MPDKIVRFGIVGLGNMGRGHTQQFAKFRTEHPEANFRLAAVCDKVESRVKAITDEHAVKGFTDYQAFLRSGDIDAVLIATPHYFHPPEAIAAFEAGLHVLCEKPMAVNASAADAMKAAAAKSGKTFAMMFQNRNNPQSQAIKKLMSEGVIGKLLRVTYTRTDWLRTRAYYKSSDWRATWKGEGGGILMNQAPHDLDLICWLVGVPKRVSAFCRTLRHEIEVEDFAAGVIEFDNGAIGFFQSTTAESPGRNSLEIVGDKGSILLEHGKVYLTAVADEDGQPSDTLSIIQTSPKSFPGVKRQAAQEVPLPPKGGAHVELVANFADHLLQGTPLVAPGAEGHWATELANAFYLSSETGQPANVPVDRAAVDRFYRSRGAPV